MGLQSFAFWEKSQSTKSVWSQFESFPSTLNSTKIDKVWMYKEMMMNDDNVESSLLTSSLLKISSLYKFCYKLHMLSWRSRWTELCSSYIYEEVCCTSEVCWGSTSIYTSSVYHSLQGSIMGCSLRVTRAGVADHECEC